ncbi:MAG TPA: MoaD/ThiS family protein [Acidimicrobiales bacterium]|nr:MoaD/ThiS family protein [Acidimicrobiales bacterium]
MVRLILLGPAHEAAGVREDLIEGDTVGAVLALARARYGEAFAAVLATSQVWVNGEPAEAASPVADYDEVAVLPPVSGG